MIATSSPGAARRRAQRASTGDALKAVQRIHAGRELLHVFTDDDGVNSFSWNVSDVVVMSTTSLEAGINESAQFIDAHPLYPCPMPDDFDRLRLRMKWSLLPLIARVDPFDRGGSAVQYEQSVSNSSM